MAFTGKLFGKVWQTLFNAEIDWDTHAIHAQLTTNAEVPDQDADIFWDAAQPREIAASGGYSTNGVALGSKTVNYTGASNTYMFDAADPSWATATFTFRNVHFVDRNAGSDAARPQLGYQSNDADITGGGGTLTLVLASAGLIELVAA